MSFNHGSVWWSELMTRDVETAIDWYRKVCGWSFERTKTVEGAPYHIAIAHGKRIAGIMDMNNLPHMAEMAPHWFTYFAVDNVEHAMEQTRAAGGEVVREPFDVPHVGRIVLLRDPTGAALGAITPVFPGDALAAADREAELADPETDDEIENFPI